MSASEEPKDEAERGPDEVGEGRLTGRSAEEGHEVPLFLRGRSDGNKGNAQDEKDETVE
jgi:hypothetical protein